MFVMRLRCSGRDFAWLYPRQDQVCFLDGHVRAFAHFGCVPHRLAYDTRILVGSERELSARFLALGAHYLIEPSFATRAASSRVGKSSEICFGLARFNAVRAGPFAWAQRLP